MLIKNIIEAFEAYKTYVKKEQELDLGTKHLMIYGVLEALYLQQEALKDLCDALNYEQIHITEKNNPKIYKIRETRNDVAGHPTYRRGDYSTYLSISDLSLKKIRYHETKKDNAKDFDILVEGICTQEKFIKEQLEKILSKLRDKTKEYIHS